MMLSWTGARLEGGQYEKANVNATDNHSSTCMHYAAAAGMKICVEVRERALSSVPLSGRAASGGLSVGSPDHISSSEGRLTMISDRLLHPHSPVLCLITVRSEQSFLLLRAKLSLRSNLGDSPLSE